MWGLSMWLAHKLVELQGISEIFLSRTAWYFTAKISYLAAEILWGGFVLSCHLWDALCPPGWWCALPESSTATADRRKCNLPLFPASVTIFIFLWTFCGCGQKLGHLHVGGKLVPIAGKFICLRIFIAKSTTSKTLAHQPGLDYRITFNAIIYSSLGPWQLCSRPCGIFHIWHIFVHTWRINLISL